MKLLGIVQAPNSSPKKYIARFNVDGKTVSVGFGAKGYGDYIQYSRENPELATEKRKQYIARHRVSEDWTDPMKPGTLSRFILWEEPTLSQAVKGYKRRFHL